MVQYLIRVLVKVLTIQLGQHKFKYIVQYPYGKQLKIFLLVGNASDKGVWTDAGENILYKNLFIVVFFNIF